MPSSDCQRDLICATRSASEVCPLYLDAVFSDDDDACPSSRGEAAEADLRSAHRRLEVEDIVTH